MNTSPSSPFQELRKELNLTQHATAVRAHCSKHLVVRAEQGCFTDPPPVLVNFFTQQRYPNHDPTPESIQSQYYAFQTAVRKANRRFLGSVPPYELMESITRHPLIIWRGWGSQQFSLTELAKRLCVNQSTLHRFESKPSLQQQVPTTLLTALEECGYDSQEIKHFLWAYEQFRSGLTSNYRDAAASPVGEVKKSA